jgi:type VI protein secretion system component Hcp
MRKRIIQSAIPISAAVFFAGAWLAPAGVLNPPAGPVQPTMNSLSQIHSLAQSIEAALESSAGGGAAFPDDPLFAGVNLQTAMQDAFLFLDGIPGDATEPGHMGWVNLLSVSQMVDNPGGVGPAMFGPIRVLAKMDRSLPPLLEQLATGDLIASVMVDFTKPASVVRFLRLELVGVTVTSVTPLYQAGAFVAEFTPQIINVTFTPLDETGQPTGPDVEFCWNLVMNAPC